MYVRIFVYICMYLCICMYIYVCMQSLPSLCMLYVSLYIPMYVCTGTYRCMYLCIYLCSIYVCMCVSMYISMYVCVHCMHISQPRRLGANTVRAVSERPANKKKSGMPWLIPHAEISFLLPRRQRPAHVFIQEAWVLRKKLRQQQQQAC